MTSSTTVPLITNRAAAVKSRMKRCTHNPKVFTSATEHPHLMRNSHAFTFRIPVCFLGEVCCLVFACISCNATTYSAHGTLCSPLRVREGQEKCYDNHLALIAFYYDLNDSAHRRYVATQKTDSTFSLT